MVHRRSASSRLLFSSVILIVYMMGQFALGPHPAHAATITVTTTADAVTTAPCTGGIPAQSLRAALCGALNPGDIVNITVAGPIVLAANLPTITVGGAGLTINGNPTTIQGGTNIRGFTIVSGGALTLNNLTVTSGNCNATCPITVSGGGGALNYGTLTISNSTLSGNSAPVGGGVFNGGTLTISNSTLSGNSASAGGGVFNNNGTLTISNSTLSGNSAPAGSGGGVFNTGGTLTISNSTLSGNSASAGGGGGAYNTGGTLTISNSTLSGNSAPVGGGVFNYNGTLTISNSTLSGNSASAGGGVYNGGTLTISNSTLSGNSALAGGGVYNFGIATVQNTIVTVSTGGDCAGNAWAPGSANNRTTDTCAGNLGAVTGLSATLANNGGPTQTLALLTGSNAIDQPGVPCLVTTDQRGYSRPVGTGCDIGAFEFGAGSPLPPAPAAVTSAGGSAPNWPVPPPCPDAMTRVDPAIRANLPPGIARAANGVLATVYICPLTNTVEIGVLDRPILRAYEVFALTPGAGASVTRFSASIRVCLQGTGAFLFRDANNSPRVVIELPASVEGGFTCASVPNAGTMVLVPGSPSVTASQTVSEWPLTGCQITTRNITNLHDHPAANAPVFALIATNTTLRATARAGDWIKVIYQDRQGYVSAAIVNTDGACE